VAAVGIEADLFDIGGSQSDRPGAFGTNAMVRIGMSYARTTRELIHVSASGHYGLERTREVAIEHDRIGTQIDADVGHASVSKCVRGLPDRGP
jgi:hypothetical protein